MEKYEEYIGREFIGFKFLPASKKGCYAFSFNEDGMNKFIGKKVKIEKYASQSNSFVIKEKNGELWHFPAEQTIENLVNIDEKKMIKDLNKLLNKIKNYVPKYK